MLAHLTLLCPGDHQNEASNYLDPPRKEHGGFPNRSFLLFFVL